MSLLLDAWACWREAWADQPPWTQQPAHACDPGCPLWRHGVVYICCWSGQMHVCTAGACDRLVTCDDAQACSLTSLSYQLDFGYGFEEGFGREEHRRATNTDSGARKRKAPGGADGMSTQTKRNCAALKRLIRATTEKSPVKKAEAAPEESIYNVRRNKLNEVNDTNVCICSLFPTGNKPSEDKLTQMRTCVLRTFARVQATSSYASMHRRHMKHPYTLLAHTVAVVHSMASGGEFWRAGHAYIPTDAWVRENLPKITDQNLDVLKPKQQKQVRKTTKQLKLFMREFEQSHALNDL